MELLCLEDTDGNVIKLQVPCRSESGLFCHDETLSNQYCDEFVRQLSNKVLANSSLIVVVDSLHAKRSISCHELKSTRQKHILRRTKVQNKSPVLKLRGESELLIKKRSATIETRVRTTATSTVRAGGSLPKARRTAKELIDQYTSAVQCPHDLPEDNEALSLYTIEAVPVKYEETELSLQPPNDNTKINTHVYDPEITNVRKRDTRSYFHPKIYTQHKRTGSEITNALTKDCGTDAGSGTRTFASPEVTSPDINDAMSRKTENATTNHTAAASPNVGSEDTKGDTFGPNPNCKMKIIVFGSEITKELSKKIDVSTAVRKPTDEELKDITGSKNFSNAEFYLDGTDKPPETHESVAFIYPCCPNNRTLDKQKSGSKKHIESTEKTFNKDSIKCEDKLMETDMDAGSETGEPTTKENNTNTNPEVNHELLKRYQNVSFPGSSTVSSMSCCICGKSMELEVDAPACTKLSLRIPTQRSMSSSNRYPDLEMDTPGSRPVTPIMNPGQKYASEPRAAMSTRNPEPRPINKPPPPANYIPTPYPVPRMPMPSSLPTRSERIPMVTSDPCPKIEMGTPDSRPVNKMYQGQQYASEPLTIKPTASPVTSPVEKCTPVKSLPESGNPRNDGLKLQTSGTGSDGSWGKTSTLSEVSTGLKSNEISKDGLKFKVTGSNERRAYVSKTVDGNESAETKPGQENIETLYSPSPCRVSCICPQCAKQHEMLSKGTQPDLSKTRSIATSDTRSVDAPAGRSAVLGSNGPHTAVMPKPGSEKPKFSGIKLQSRGTGSSKLCRTTPKPKEPTAPKSKEISEVELSSKYNPTICLSKANGSKPEDGSILKKCHSNVLGSCEQPTKTKALKFNTLLAPKARWSCFKRRRSEKNRMDTDSSTVTVDNELTKQEHNDQTCCAKPFCLNKGGQEVDNLSKPCGTTSKNHPQSASNVRQVKNDVTTEPSYPSNSASSAEFVPSNTSSAKSRRSKYALKTSFAKLRSCRDAQKNNQTPTRCPSSQTKSRTEIICKCAKENKRSSWFRSKASHSSNAIAREISNNDNCPKSTSSQYKITTCPAKSNPSKDTQKENNQTTTRYPSNEIHTKSQTEFISKKSGQEIINSTCSSCEKEKPNPSQNFSNVRKVKNDITTEPSSPSNSACSVLSIASKISSAISHSSQDALNTCSAKSCSSKDAQKNYQTPTRCPSSERQTKSQTEIICKCAKENKKSSWSRSKASHSSNVIAREICNNDNCPKLTSSQYKITTCPAKSDPGKDAQKKNNQTTTRYPSNEIQTRSQTEFISKKPGQEIENSTCSCCEKEKANPLQNSSNVRKVKNDVITVPSSPSNCACSVLSIPSKTSSAKSHSNQDALNTSCAKSRSSQDALKPSSTKSCSSKDAQKNNQTTTGYPSSERQTKSQTEIICKCAKENKKSSGSRSKASHSSNAIAREICNNDNCQKSTSSQCKITTCPAKSDPGKDTQKKKNQTTTRCPSNEIHTKSQTEFISKKPGQEIVNSSCSSYEKEKANPLQNSSNVRKVKNDVTTEPSSPSTCACSVLSIPSKTSSAKSHSNQDALNTSCAKSRSSKDAQKNNQTPTRCPSSERQTKSQTEIICKCAKENKKSSWFRSKASHSSNGNCQKSTSSQYKITTCHAKSDPGKDAQKKNNQTTTRYPSNEIHTKSQAAFISKKAGQEIVNSTCSSCEKKQPNPSHSSSNVRQVNNDVTTEPSSPSNCACSVLFIPSKTSSAKSPSSQDAQNTSSAKSCSSQDALKTSSAKSPSSQDAQNTSSAKSCSSQDAPKTSSAKSRCSKEAQKNNQTTTGYPSSEKQTKKQIELICKKCGQKTIISTWCRCTKGQAHRPQSPSHDTHVKNDLTTKPSNPSNCACLTEAVPTKTSSAKSRPSKDALKNNQTTTRYPSSERQTKSQTEFICKCGKESINSSGLRSKKSHSSNAIAKEIFCNDNRQTSTSQYLTNNKPCYCLTNPIPVKHSVSTGTRVSCSHDSLQSNSGIHSEVSEVSAQKRQDLTSAKLKDGASVQTELPRTCLPPPPCRSKLARSFKRIQELTSGASYAYPGKAGEHDVTETGTKKWQWTASCGYDAVKKMLCRCPEATLATSSQQTEIKTSETENITKKSPVKLKKSYKRDTKGVISWEQYEINKKKKKKSKCLSTDVSVPIPSCHQDCCKCTGKPHDIICECKQSSKHICESRQSLKHIICECKHFTRDICKCLVQGFKMEVKAKHNNGSPLPRCCTTNR